MSAGRALLGAILALNRAIMLQQMQFRSSCGRSEYGASTRKCTELVRQAPCWRQASPHTAHSAPARVLPSPEQCAAAAYGEAIRPTCGPVLASVIPGANIVAVYWAMHTAVYRLDRIHPVPTAAQHDRQYSPAKSPTVLTPSPQHRHITEARRLHCGPIPAAFPQHRVQRDRALLPSP